MKKNLKKVLALLLAMTMVLGMVACKKEEVTDNGGGSDANVNTTPLVVGYSTFSQKFSPFTGDTQYDMDVANLTQVFLMTTDRLGGIIKNGIAGETIPYNGTDYTYYGIADLDWSYDAATDKTTYTAKLREDLVFSDGVPVTADDIIFTYYVYLDNSYTGSTSLSSYDIVGLKNYQCNSTAAEGVSVDDAEVQALIANPTDELLAFENDYVAGVLTSEMSWCQGAAANYGYDDYVTMMIDFYAKEDVTATDEAGVLAEIIAQYGPDYKTLGANYGGDEAYFAGDIYAEAYNELFNAAVAAAGGEEVDYIEGITKIDDYTVQVVTNGYEAPAVYTILGIAVTPLHYYGDTSLYDYDAHKFGFTRGDLTAVNAHEQNPLGAGPYVFKEYANKTVYFEANENYYLGAPKIKEIQFKEVTVDENAANVQSGTVDMGELTGSVTRFQEVQSYNSNGELSGDVITTCTVDNLGYGYIGCNADTVNVGGDSSSEASKDLRKALMTVLSVYRDTNIDSYYGEAASVINYPISNTSWAAPQATDSDYKLAYSTDVEGNPIYTADMTPDDKYAAALEACKGYLVAAGFTWDEGAGKFTAAPEGAKLSYEVIIPGEGNGSHPSYGILNDAKAAFESIGIELVINDPADSNVLWNSLDAGTQELWCAAWSSTIDPDMYQTYYSTNIVGLGGTDSNHYHLSDTNLDSLIMSARLSDDQTYRKTIYKECLETILDWAVELPVYQRQNCVIFSTERINIDTITPDITTFYKWQSEIEKMEMN